MQLMLLSAYFPYYPQNAISNSKKHFDLNKIQKKGIQGLYNINLLHNKKKYKSKLLLKCIFLPVFLDTDGVTRSLQTAAPQPLSLIFRPVPAPCRKPAPQGPRNAKRRQDFSCRQVVPAITVQGSRKAAAARSSPPGSAARRWKVFVR